MSEQLVFDHYPLDKEPLAAGWTVASIGEISRLVASGFPSGQHNQEKRGVPHLRPMNVDREGRLDLSTLKYVDGAIPRELSKGDVLFNNTNSPELIGKTAVVSIDKRLAYSNHMTRICLEAGFDPAFIAYHLHYLWMSGYFRHRCVNHVNQASISADPLSQTVPVVIAPSSEQSRIANVLDELFSGLDAGVKALERARGKLELYRASVLKASVEGVLTAEWRKEHLEGEPASELLKRILVERRRRWEQKQLRKFDETGKAPPKNWKTKYKEPVAPDTADLPPLPEGWCWVSIDQLLREPLRNGRSAKIVKNGGGIPTFSLSAVTEGDFSEKNIKLTSVDSQSVQDLWVETDDIFIQRANTPELVGTTKRYTEENGRAIFPDLLIRARVVPLVPPAFIELTLQSSRCHAYFRSQSQGIAGSMPKIDQDAVRLATIPLPPLIEQKVIVEAVEDQISVIKSLEMDIDAKLQSAQALRQSMLRYAFAGKLVPQDPNDEPASELLKRIAAEREARAREAAAKKREARKTNGKVGKRRGRPKKRKDKVR